MSDKTNSFIKTKFFSEMVYCMWKRKYGERFCCCFVTFLTRKSYSNFIYIKKKQRKKKRKKEKNRLGPEGSFLKQLSKELHGINHALKKKKKKKRGGGGGERNAFQGKNNKIKCSWFCIQVDLFCCCFVVCCCCCFFFLFFDGPPGTARLVTQHVYLVFGYESTQTSTAASTSA